MKRISALILALLLALSLAACQGKEKRVTSSSDLHLSHEDIERLAREDN